MISALHKVTVLALLAAGTLFPCVAHSDAKTGEELARSGNEKGATACAPCHGLDGSGQTVAGYPRLGGLPESYLLKQLQDFADGSRQNDIMNPIAGALSENERKQLAQYYASQEPLQEKQSPKAPADADRLLGKRIAYLGKWKQGVPACVRCHGEDGRGIPPRFPPIAAQHFQYLEGQMKHFKEGKRTNDPLGLMRSVAQALTDDEIHAVAAYFASVPPGKAAAAGKERAMRQSYEVPESSESEAEPAFHSPPEAQMPEDEFGKMVLLGKQIFVDTQHYARKYVGNGLNCVNCHLDRGRLDDSAPMGPAYVRYPRFRGKNQQVNTMEQRIQGCFRYSQNGTPPPALSKEMKALVSYFYWLATDARVNREMETAGFVDIENPPKPPNATRGKQVFAQECALCHGDDGQGTEIDGRYQFPPLWGEHSFNWGAGMHRINTAAAFIQANMPLGKGGSLPLQEAWDVAAYVNSHERPQDPRFNGDLEQTDEQFHDHRCLYGDRRWGKQLGDED